MKEIIYKPDNCDDLAKLLAFAQTLFSQYVQKSAASLLSMAVWHSLSTQMTKK